MSWCFLPYYLIFLESQPFLNLAAHQNHPWCLFNTWNSLPASGDARWGRTGARPPNSVFSKHHRWMWRQPDLGTNWISHTFKRNKWTLQGLNYFEIAVKEAKWHWNFIRATNLKGQDPHTSWERMMKYNQKASWNKQQTSLNLLESSSISKDNVSNKALNFASRVSKKQL